MTSVGYQQLTVVGLFPKYGLYPCLTTRPLNVDLEWEHAVNKTETEYTGVKVAAKTNQELKSLSIGPV